MQPELDRWLLTDIAAQGPGILEGPVDHVLALNAYLPGDAGKPAVDSACTDFQAGGYLFRGSPVNGKSEDFTLAACQFEWFVQSNLLVLPHSTRFE